MPNPNFLKILWRYEEESTPGETIPNCTDETIYIFWKSKSEGIISIPLLALR